MKKLQATEYMYASSRIRALENRLIGRERMDVLVESKTAADVMNKLAEYGLSPADEGEGGAPTGQGMTARREAMLLSALREAYDEVATSVPEASVYAWFRYPYDCHNIKTVIKCQLRGIDPAEMLFDFGTVSAEETVRRLTEGKYESFPPAMAAAVLQAKEAYAKTGDPQQIDAILDIACYEDMLACAEAAGVPALTAWVKAKIDLVNIMITLRILRMKRGETGRIFMNTSLLSGGTLPKSFFDDAYEGGEEALWGALTGGTYAAFAARAEGTDQSLSAIEKCADDAWMSLVRDGARVPFGPEVAGGYLAGWETAVKNIRIILAGKDAGLAPDVLRERIRESYV